MADTCRTLAGAALLDPVRDILHRVLGAARDDIHPHSSIECDLVCCELDAAEIALAIEDRFGIGMQDHEVPGAGTVAGLLDLIAQRQAGA